jgi:hypothetical protein
MADQMLSDFFTGKKLTELVQSEAIKRGVQFALPPQFLTEGSSRPVGDQVEWDEVSGNRAMAQIVNSLSPSKRVNMKGVTRRYATAVISKEHVNYDANFLMELKSDNPFRAEGARRKIVQNTADFRSRFDALRVGLVQSAITQGKIWIDADGNVLPTLTGAVITIDYNIPVGNIQTKTGTLGDWSSAGTDIVGNLKAQRVAALKSNGWWLNNIIYGKNILGYLLANTQLNLMIARNPGYNQAILEKNDIPPNFLGFNWFPGESAYMVKQDGTTTASWVGDNQIIMFPDVDASWYELVPAGTIIPRSVVNAGASLDAMLNECEATSGYWSYAEMLSDPISIKQIAGDGCLPVIKVPGVMWYFTVA